MHHRPGFAAQSNSLIFSFFLFSYFLFAISLFFLFLSLIIPIFLYFTSSSLLLLFIFPITCHTHILFTQYSQYYLSYRYFYSTSPFSLKFTLSHSKIIYKFLANLLLKQHKKLFTVLSSPQNLSQ